MNRGSIEKLALICAAAGITPSEWDDFLTEVRQSGSSETSRLFSRIRTELRKMSQGLDEEVAHDGPMELTQASIYRDVARLIEKANISNTTAVRRISIELERQFPNIDEDVIHFNSKSGLRRWLKKLINEFGDSVVLAAASQALGRNQSASWRLG